MTMRRRYRYNEALDELEEVDVQDQIVELEVSKTAEKEAEEDAKRRQVNPGGYI